MDQKKSTIETIEETTAVVGHVYRMVESRKEKQVLEMKVEWTAPRGYPWNT